MTGMLTRLDKRWGLQLWERKWVQMLEEMKQGSASKKDRGWVHATLFCFIFVLAGGNRSSVVAPHLPLQLPKKPWNLLDRPWIWILWCWIHLYLPPAGCASHQSPSSSKPVVVTRYDDPIANLQMFVGIGNGKNQPWSLHATFTVARIGLGGATVASGRMFAAVTDPRIFVLLNEIRANQHQYLAKLPQDPSQVPSPGHNLRV